MELPMEPEPELESIPEVQSAEPGPEPEPEPGPEPGPEPEPPGELRRFDYTNVGSAASVIVYRDEYGNIRTSAAASIEGVPPFEMAVAGTSETISDAAKKGALEIFSWAKDVNAASKPGLAKAVSMAIITFVSKIVKDANEGVL